MTVVNGNDVVPSKIDRMCPRDFEENLFVLANGDIEWLLIMLSDLLEINWVYSPIKEESTFSGSRVHRTNSS